MALEGCVTLAKKAENSLKFSALTDATLHIALQEAALIKKILATTIILTVARQNSGRM